MKKYLYLILGMVVMFAGTVYALPYFSSQKTLIPTDANQDLGTTTVQTGQGSTWRRIYIQGSDGCLTLVSNLITPSGVACGSGSGGGISFSADSNFNQQVYSTSTPTLWFKSGLFASSTSWFNNIQALYASSTGFSSFYASSTFQTIGNLTFGGVTASTWPAFCVTITGSSDLCDGNDASGAGGSSAYETATTSDIALSQVAYIAKVSGRTTLASAATSTLTGTGPISISNSPNILGASGAVISCATCLTSYDPFTHSTQYPFNSATTSIISIGTTTPYYSLTVASTTGAQIALSDGTAGIAQWTFRNAGGNFYISTTTVAGTATTSVSLLSIDGTTGTSTFSGGIRIKKSPGFLDFFSNATNPTLRSGISFYEINESPQFGIMYDGSGIGDANKLVLTDPVNAVDRVTFLRGGATGIGTTTPSAIANLTLATTTTPQLSLSAGLGLSQWMFRNAGGDFFLSTSTVTGESTTTKAAFSITNGGVYSISTSTTGVLQVGANGNLFVGPASGSGTVTSVDIASADSSLTVGGGAITTSGTLTAILNMANINSWTGRQNFLNASSSLFSAGYAKIGSSASTTIDTAGNVTLPAAGLLTIPALTTGILSVDAGGQVFRTATSTPTVTAPITYSGTLGQFNGGASGAFGCTSASAGVAGCITATDYSILKTATTTFTWPLIYTNSTNAATWGGLSTSSAIASGAAVLYATGVNTMASAATGTISASGGITVTAAQSVIGSGLTVGCTVATVSVAGCISAGSFSQFNSATTTFSSPLTYTLGTNAVTCATCLTSYDPFSHSTQYPFNFSTTSTISIGTTTPYYNTFASTTGPQLMLGGRLTNGGVSDWTLRSVGGNLYLATTTTAGTATSSAASAIAFGLNGSVTFPGLLGCDTINSDATGLFVCGNDGGITSYDAWTHSTQYPYNSATTSRMGFGTTTPYYNTFASTTGPQLAFSDGTAGIASWAVRNAGGDLSFSTTTTAGSATTSTAALTLLATGKPGLAISSSTPFATLSVNPLAGDFSAQFAVGSTSKSSFIIDNSGHIFAPLLSQSAGAQTYTVCGAATTFEIIFDTLTCATSAAKYKTNIDDLDIGLSELMKVRPVVYNWILTGNPAYDNDRNINHQQIGLIADEVEKIDSRLVTYDKEGEIHGFNYEQYTAWLTKAIQELNTKVENMQIGKVKRSMEENWQWGVIGLLVLWNLYLTFRKRK